MKKPINLLLAIQTVLLIAVASVMFSSCIIVHPNDDEDIHIEKRERDKKAATSQSGSTENGSEETATGEKFTITCKNETSMVVANWFVKNDNIITLSKTGFTGSIQAHGEDKIFDLPKGYYKIYFTFENGYSTSESITLDKDVIYCIYGNNNSYTVECRNVK